MWALLPLKNLENAKLRLSPVLTPYERKMLFRNMLQDVLRVLDGHPQLAGIALVSDDSIGSELAQTFNAMLINESKFNKKGLNGAIEQGVAVLASKGIDDVLIIHGDLPLLTVTEISQLINLHNQAQMPKVTIAPDTDLQGSNCMICSPASLMRFHYGANSFAKHRVQALTLGANFSSLSLEGAGFDIDFPEDLTALITRLDDDESTSSATRRYLAQSGIKERVTQLQTVTSNFGLHHECATAAPYKFNQAG